MIRYRPVVQMSKDGKDMQFFSSVRDAEQLTGISKHNISSVLNKRSKTAGGYLWRWAYV